MAAHSLTAEIDPTQSPNAVVSKAVIRAARSLGLNNAELAAVLGLSEASISRLATGAYKLDRGSKPYELALLLIRLLRSLHPLVGGESGPMEAWMRSHNLAIDGVPAESIKTIAGLVDVVTYVDSARAKI